MSAKRQTEKRLYDKMTKPQYLQSHPRCEIGPIISKTGRLVKCRFISRHIHHVKGRRGSLLNDTRFFLASCNGECHPQWVHQTHVAEARELGLIA